MRRGLGGLNFGAVSKQDDEKEEGSGESTDDEADDASKESATRGDKAASPKKSTKKHKSSGDKGPSEESDSSSSDDFRVSGADPAGEESSEEDEDHPELCLGLKSGVHSIMGKRLTMEDTHFVLIDSPRILATPEGKERVINSGFFGVYDGHGGDQTAQYLAEHLYNNVVASGDIKNDLTGMTQLREALIEGFGKTEKDFITLASANMIDAGSTAVTAMVIDRKLIVANVGDSEGVLCRRGKAVALSTIHNPRKNADEEKRIVDGGGRLYQKRLAHPAMPPGVCNIAVSRAFGDLMFKHESYLKGKDSCLTATPDYKEINLVSSDEFLVLACDGVWDVMPQQEVVTYVRQALADSHYNVQVAAKMLVERALELGSTDNITAVVVLLEFTPMDDAAEDAKRVLAELAVRASRRASIIPGKVTPRDVLPPCGALRNLPGTKRVDLYAWPTTAFQATTSGLDVEQQLQQLVRVDPAATQRILAEPEGVDTMVWQYEHLRQLTLELNHLAVQLLRSGVCTPATCSQMKATDEWMYLCAAHKEPKECCAMDYILHTLDGSAALLNSHKHFPNRASVESSTKNYFQSIARRLYRINAHAYFHHRDVFTQFEDETHLTERFIEMSIKFDLIPSKMRIIPTDFYSSRN